MNTDLETLDVQEFIESFRQSLSAPDSAQDAQLTDMLNTFSLLCDDANRRLRECTALAQKGLYANAVALAEREPNLMDRCSLLEIPERDILPTVATAVGVKAPSILNRDLVEALQETYQKGTSAEGNVKFLHRLTLARAPLPTRLTIMRRLQVQDPNRPFIDTDIRAFEKAWFKRVLDFVQPYVKAGNVEVLEEVLSDLEENGYLETPPQQVISGLRTHLAKAQALQFPALAEEIRAAHDARDIGEMKQLANRWKQLVTQTGTNDATAKYQVAAAFAWLRQVQAEESRAVERGQAKAQLIELLSHPQANRVEVDQAFRAAHQLQAIDPELEARYQSWVRGLGRKKLLLVGSCAAGVALLIGVAGIGYLQQANRAATAQKVNSYVKKIQTLVEKKEFATAVAEGKNADPVLAEHPQVVAVLQLASNELKSSEAYASAIQALETASLDDKPEELEEAALAAARDEEDRNKVKELVEKLRLRRTKEIEKVQEDFDASLATLKQKVDTLMLNVEKRTFGLEQGELYEKCRLEFIPLEETARKQGLKTTVMTRVKTELETVKPWKNVAAKLSQFSNEMASVAATDDTLRRTSAFLRITLAAVHPDNRSVKRAKASEKDLAIWLKAYQLQEVLKTGKIDARIKSEWANQPPSEAIDAAFAPAEMLRQRDFSLVETEAYKLKTRLLDPDIKSVYCLRTKTAGPWYTKQFLKEGANAVDVLVLRDNTTDGAKLETIHGKRLDTVDSPQTKLMPEFLKLWTGNPEPNQWHRRLADVYEKLAVDQEIEPLLKLQLMRKFLKVAVESSIGYRQLLSPLPEFKSITGSKGIIEGDWYNPETELSKERKDATELCGKAPRLIKFATEAARRDTMESSKYRGGVNLVGLLKQDYGGPTSLVKFSNVTPESGSELYVISEGDWTKVGVYRSDSSALLNDAAKQFTAWPVFSVRSAQSSP